MDGKQPLLKVPERAVERTDETQALRTAKHRAARLVDDDGVVAAGALRDVVRDCSGDTLLLEMLLSQLPYAELQRLRAADAELARLLHGDVVNAALIRAVSRRKQELLCLPLPEAQALAVDGLVLPVYENGYRRADLVCRELDEHERSHFMVRGHWRGPRADEPLLPPLVPGGAAVVSRLEQFRLQLDVFSAGLLRNVDLGGSVVLAGSALVACLAPLPPRLQRLANDWHEYVHTVRSLPLPPTCTHLIEQLAGVSPAETRLREALHQFYHGQTHRYGGLSPYRNSDLDLFLTRRDPAHGLALVERLVAQIRANIPVPSTLVRTRNAVTVVSERPYRNVQIVIMCLRNLEEQLVFADMDVTAVAYDGRQVYMHERARRAFTTRYNFVPPGDLKREPTADRVLKYAARGFGTLFFELCKHTPRCDVVYDAAYAEAINRITARNGPTGPSGAVAGGYDDTFVPYVDRHFDLPSMLGAVADKLRRDHTRNQERQRQRAGDTFRPQPFQRPWVVGDTLADVADGLPFGEPEAAHGLKGLRWKADELLTTEWGRLFLPSCYMCNQRFLPATDGGKSTSPVCPSCAELNRTKREQTADLRGKLALVTGGRIKIGFHTALKLLRAGARVIVTTRFPQLAAQAFAAEPDAAVWLHRLDIYDLDLRLMPRLLQFVEDIKAHHGPIDILVNNAAQTVRRPPAYYREMAADEQRLAAAAPPLACRVHGATLAVTAAPPAAALTGSPSASAAPMSILPFQAGSLARTPSAALSQLALVPEDVARDDALFPPGERDAHGEPLDLRPSTTWNRTLADVSAVEILETQLINVVAPTLLMQLIQPHPHGHPRFVINVTSQEGQFSAVKTAEHAHTNMAKSKKEKKKKKEKEKRKRKKREREVDVEGEKKQRSRRTCG